MSQFEPPEPYLGPDTEPRVNLTQWIAIGIIALTALLLTSWITFIRCRLLRSRSCATCGQRVELDGTERVGGWRRRIWHAGCWEGVEAAQRGQRARKGNNGNKGQKRHGGDKKGEEAGVNRKARDRRSRLMADATNVAGAGGSEGSLGSDASGSIDAATNGKSHGAESSVDVEKGQSPAGWIHQQDRPRLSVLVGRRPGHPNSSNSPASAKPATGASDPNAHAYASTMSIASKMTPKRYAKETMHQRQASVQSHQAAVDVSTLPVLMRMDDTGSFTGSGHQRGRGSNGSSISITLHSSTAHQQQEAQNISTGVPAPGAKPPQPQVPSNPSSPISPVNSSTKRQSYSKRQSTLLSDTASIHSIHSVHSVHKPSPLRESVATLPPLENFGGVPPVPAVKRDEEGNWSPVVGTPKGERWGKPPRIPRKVSNQDGPGQGGRGVPVRSASLGVQTMETDPYLDTRMRQTPERDQVNQIVGAPHPGGGESIQRSSGGYSDQTAVHAHYELPVLPETIIPARHKSLTAQPTQTSQVVPLEHTHHADHSHIGAMQNVTQPDFARPSSFGSGSNQIAWGESVNQALQAAGTRQLAPVTRSVALDHIAGPHVGGAQRGEHVEEAGEEQMRRVEPMEMPDPARYSLRPPRVVGASLVAVPQQQNGQVVAGSERRAEWASHAI